MKIFAVTEYKTDEHDPEIATLCKVCKTREDAEKAVRGFIADDLESYLDKSDEEDGVTADSLADYAIEQGGEHYADLYYTSLHAIYDIFELEI